MIQRLMDIPYISDEFINQIESRSAERFNFLVQELKCDPMNLLERLLVDDQSESYDGVWLIINYGLFLSENDSHMVSYPEKGLSIEKRSSLSNYLDPLNSQKIAFMVFSHFTHEAGDESRFEQRVEDAIQNWYDAHPEDKDILEEYFQTKCLDKVLTRMIEIRRKFIYE